MLENGVMFAVQAFSFYVVIASTTYTKYKLQIKQTYVTYKINFHFPMRKSLNIFSCIARDSMIARNK